MIWLAIDTAYPALSVALFDDDRLLAAHHEAAATGQAELLVPAIAALLGRVGVTRADGIAVDIGPGSYTGIRIGLAAARALGLAWEAPVYGLSGTVLAAAAAFDADPLLMTVGVALAAGRGRAHVEAFDRALTPLTALNTVDAGDIARALPPGIAIIEALPRAAAARLLPAALRALPPTPRYLGSTAGPAFEATRVLA